MQLQAGLGARTTVRPAAPGPILLCRAHGLAVAIALLSGSPTPTAAQSVQGQPSWSYEGQQSGAAAGTIVVNAGDTDADGFDDVLVGAPGYDGAAIDGGVAWLFAGGPAGLGAGPSWTYADTLGGGASIQAIAGVGDVNGDGFPDIAVGIPDASSTGGRVLVFTGAVAGLGAAPFATLTGGAMAQFGASLSGAGDMDDDGFADLLVGGWAEGAGPGDGGARGGVWLFAGSSSGLAQVWSATGPDLGDAFGWSVSGGGDVDADGHLDVVVGGTGHADDRGALWFFPGDGSTAASTALWTQSGAAPGELLGTALGPLVDLGGDGRADILAAGLGDPSDGPPDAGRADLWFGETPHPLAAASWSTTGLAASDVWGRALGAGDIDGDGSVDLLVGAPGAGDGVVHLFAGAPGGPTATAAQVLLPSSGTVAGFGRALALADVNGDSLLDVVVGAPATSNGEDDEGAAFLYLGAVADADGDGDLDGTDCDDIDATVFNGAEERCDGADQDCDALTDDGFPDLDGDGAADCVDNDADGDLVLPPLDCDDLDADTRPGLGERCAEPGDEDCDGDEDGADSDCPGDDDADDDSAADDRSDDTDRAWRSPGIVVSCNSDDAAWFGVWVPLVGRRRGARWHRSSP